MSFLTPLYGLAALAIALPIVFHLVRQRPKLRREFSSLMFLDAVPPRLSQKSRIENWLLLILRIAAIGLLVAAFTRPYWNLAKEAEVQGSSVRRVLLIDTSASMRRMGLFDRALEKAKEFIQQGSGNDVVAVYAFDKTLKPLFSLDTASSMSPLDRKQAAVRALESAKVTWFDTDLGNALVTASDLLLADTDAVDESMSEANEIVVVSDLQSGTSLDKLSSYNWPRNCKVRFERVEAITTGNASFRFLNESNDVSDTEPKSDAKLPAKDTSLATGGDAGFQRIRVTNDSKASESKFKIAWAGNEGKPVADAGVACTVPAGESLVVRVPVQPKDTSYLELQGDNVDFDNRVYSTVREPYQSKVICLDTDEMSKESSLSYFVQHLPFSSETRSVAFESRKPAGTEDWPTAESSPLVIASHRLEERDLDGLSSYMEQGGNLLWVWDCALGSRSGGVDYARGLERLVGLADARVEEWQGKDYAMWQRIDFRHPLFVELADSRFNDFTKVRFWSHRVLEINESNTQVLSRFDDGSPAFIAIPKGNGMLWLMTAGWQPTQSQLALSSKFVPILSGLFRISAKDSSVNVAWTVGDQINADVGVKVFDPNGKEIADAVFTEPGVYQSVNSRGEKTSFAVNLIEAESTVASLDLERIERLGVNLSNDNRPAVVREAAQRQLRAVELEAQQGWWRWLVMGVLGAVSLESVFCLLGVRTK